MTILYFAWVKERIGKDEETLTLPDDVNTVGELIRYLRALSPGHDAALAEGNAVRVAVNQKMADLDAPVTEGDEVAFFPPMTGG
jgi:molybdopterin converting factor subunit 1